MHVCTWRYLAFNKNFHDYQRAVKEVDADLNASSPRQLWGYREWESLVLLKIQGVVGHNHVAQVPPQGKTY